MVVSGHLHLPQCYTKNDTVLIKRCRKIDPLDRVSIYLKYLINDVFVMDLIRKYGNLHIFMIACKEIITILWHFLIRWTLNLSAMSLLLY